MEGGPSKINLPNSHPSNSIHKAATAAQTPKPASKQTPTLPSDEIEETFSEKTRQHEINKTVVSVVAVEVVALMFMVFEVFFNNENNRRENQDHVCSARKPIACPAVLKRKLTIEPISPRSTEAACDPIALRPFPKFLPSLFVALFIAPTTAPIVMPAARKIDVTVTPYFLKISRILSLVGITASLSST